MQTTQKIGCKRMQTTHMEALLTRTTLSSSERKRQALQKASAMRIKPPAMYEVLQFDMPKTQRV
jgi:hypothetical protein